MQVVRGPILHCLADPGDGPGTAASEYLDDGVLLIEDGVIVELGDAAGVLARLPDDVPVTEYRDQLIVPGFVDCHVHFPQLDIIGSHGEQLLDWLHRYAYPAEARFADPGYAAEVAAAFVDELIANGTTTALVFGTVHAHSADAIFGAAEARGLCVVAGKVLMDVHCPPALRDDPQSAYEDSRALIERWHGRGRLGYAITPRFALTSSDEQLALAGRLAQEYPDVWVHTHLAESPDEVAQVAQRFPASRSYLDVYARNDLLRERAVFAHCLHLDDVDRAAMAAAGGGAAFCPTSNLFLGSGLFDLGAMRTAGVRCGLGTDVGGGTSLSLLRTASEAHKVLHLQGQSLSPLRALYLATLGAAETLYLDDRVGNFLPGKDADFVVLDAGGSSLLRRRAAATTNVEELLFALLTLGDDRHVAATWLRGTEEKHRDAHSTRA